jgi:NTP pyrophosphatase (non-canonical NTP hydrolase)
MTISDLQQQIRSFRDARDWMQFHNPKDMAMAISIEAAELQEHFLWVAPEQSHARAVDRRDKVQEEIADIAIYLFELADNLGVDLLAAMEEKLRKNGEKYPVEKARGRSEKYDEL